jgi:hypothetical protein
MSYQDGLPQGNYDSFTSAILTIFWVLTLDNWASVFYDTARGDLNKIMVAVYYVSWIFIGNFILLNLFLAILLDSFLEENDEEEMLET